MEVSLESRAVFVVCGLNEWSSFSVFNLNCRITWPFGIIVFWIEMFNELQNTGAWDVEIAPPTRISIPCRAERFISEWRVTVTFCGISRITAHRMQPPTREIALGIMNQDAEIPHPCDDSWKKIREKLKFEKNSRKFEIWKKFEKIWNSKTKLIDFIYIQQIMNDDAKIFHPCDDSSKKNRKDFKFKNKIHRFHIFSITLESRCNESIEGKGKLGPNAMKHVAAGAHLPTLWISLSLRNAQTIQPTTAWIGFTRYSLTNKKQCDFTATFILYIFKGCVFYRRDYVTHWHNTVLHLLGADKQASL